MLKCQHQFPGEGTGAYGEETVKLRKLPEPVLSGLSLALLLGLEEEEMGREFQASNVGDHRQGAIKSRHSNRTGPESLP